jgi:NAD+ diphosphatase
VIPVWRDRNLVCGLDAAAGARRVEPPHPGWCSWSGWTEHTDRPPDATSWALLGLDGDVPIFAADASELDDARLAALSSGGAFLELPKIASLLTAEDAALLAYARGIVGWHRRSRFCGSCGSPTVSDQAGHVRRCADPRCAAETYPRTDPAVIMLVERPAMDGAPRRCLLGRHGRLPPRAYSTLAGFVEPGESLEEAVAREVLEETGVRVSRVRYQGSQPWPFPSSLMVAFRAVADTETVVVDPHELEDARWFGAAELARFGEWDDEDAPLRLPSRNSIARALLDAWLAEVRSD